MTAPVERLDPSNPSERKNDSTSDELAPERIELPLPGEVVLRPTPARALDALVGDLLAQAMSCVRTFGDFHVALGGDTSIETLFIRLMSDPDLRAFPWDRTHVWTTHQRSNPGEGHPNMCLLMEEFFVTHADLPKSQAHTMTTVRPDADERYERQLAQAMSGRSRGQDRLDAVVVLIEPDGGAGGVALVDEQNQTQPTSDRLCLWRSEGNAQTPTLLTLSRRFLNAARMVAIVGLGADHQGVVAEAMTHRDRLTLAPVAGELRWYLDHAAAGVADEP